ncbi:MAG: hypothetical protein IJW55_02580, partial [Clostridia bacterium]|nr:hypothetical protein [Clostridia bacterium]
KILVSDRAPLLQSPLGASPLLPPAKAFYLTRYFYFYFFRLTSLTKLQRERKNLKKKQKQQK